MLLMDYPSIKVEYFTDYAEKIIWNILQKYIYTLSQRLIVEYPGDVIQAISRPQSNVQTWPFLTKAYIINRLFKQVIHKWGES